MNWPRTIDAYLQHMRDTHRIAPGPSERAYRDTLNWHAQDANVDDPRKTTRGDVRATLRRWENPNTQRNRHSLLSSFYRWMVQEGKRKDNPAEQVQRARRRAPNVIRPKRDEALAVLAACETRRERWAISLDLLAGVRNQELRGLQGRHFQRESAIWISPDIAKGKKYRWIPLLPELESVAREIREHVGLDEYVIPAQRRNPNTGEWVDRPMQRCSGQAHWRLVRRVAARAGVEATPHALRRAFADLLKAETGDLQLVQRMLGHASLATTEVYLSDPTLDDLAGKVAAISIGPTPSTARSDSRSKKKAAPSSNRNVTRSSKHSTSTASASFSFSHSNSQNSNGDTDDLLLPVIPPRGFEPRVTSPSLAARLRGVIEAFGRSEILREAARG